VPLLAIAAITGRQKDKARVAMTLESRAPAHCLDTAGIINRRAAKGSWIGRQTAGRLFFGQYSFNPVGRLDIRHFMRTFAKIGAKYMQR